MGTVISKCTYSDAGQNQNGARIKNGGIAASTMNRRTAPLPARSCSTQLFIDFGSTRNPYEYAMYWKKLGRTVDVMTPSIAIQYRIYSGRSMEVLCAS